MSDTATRTRVPATKAEVKDLFSKLVPGSAKEPEISAIEQARLDLKSSVENQVAGFANRLLSLVGDTEDLDVLKTIATSLNTIKSRAQKAVDSIPESSSIFATPAEG